MSRRLLQLRRNNSINFTENQVTQECWEDKKEKKMKTAPSPTLSGKKNPAGIAVLLLILQKV